MNAFFGNSLTVGGTLVNAAGGIIRSVPGFGGKTLSAQLDNQGTVEVNEALTLARASAQHVNSGTIVTSGAGSLSINQSGTTPSFTNVGTITLGPGGLFVTGGAMTLTGGTLTGESSVLWTNGVTLTVDVASARAPWELNNTVVTGTVTVPAGDSLRFNTGSPTMTLVNEGRVILQSSPVISGSLTTVPGSVLEVRAAVGSTSATITSGFTNNGLIELRTVNAFFGNSLTVGGTLVNAAGGIIRSVTGFGGKTLAAQLDNQGTLEVNEALTLARASAQHVNSGSILISGANLSVNQSGTTPSFANTGTITIAAGRSLAVAGGALILTGGTLTGESGLLATDGVTLTTDLNSARAPWTLANTTVTGTLTVPAGDSLLPSRALSVQGGGRIATDPQDPQGTRTLERLFQFDVVLAGTSHGDLFGQRVHVRFEHDSEPLARQWYRGIRRVFLTQFHV